MTPTSLLNSPDDKVRALTGMTPRALRELLAEACPELLRRRQQAQERQPSRRRGTGGGRKRRLSPEQEILLRREEAVPLAGAGDPAFAGLPAPQRRPRRGRPALRRFGGHLREHLRRGGRHVARGLPFGQARKQPGRFL